MNKDEIIRYYDDLMRLAVSKCGSQTDAEDLVGDTMLAAFSYINKGGRIEHPKTWLANTLCHKYSDSLRKKYRAPTTVNFEDSFEIPAEEEEYFSSEDAAKIRKELNHIAYVNREVLIRYYFGTQSVSDIAAGLGIPEGTVKSILATGRSQMKKGLETMETRENYLPGKLYLSFGGSDGPNMEPISLVENDLIAQNLLILAYEKPITVSNLSKAIGIPTAYIEPIIKKLVDGELMAETASGKVYADFLITKPHDRLKNFKPQLDFVDRHFDTIWNIIAKMSAEISGFGFVSALESKQKTELDRYAVLKALQDFQHCGAARKLKRRTSPNAEMAAGGLHRRQPSTPDTTQKNTMKLRNMPFRAVTARAKVLSTAVQGACAFTNLIPHCGIALIAMAEHLTFISSISSHCFGVSTRIRQLTIAPKFRTNLYHISRRLSGSVCSGTHRASFVSQFPY